MHRVVFACLLAATAAAAAPRTHQDWRREAAAARARHDYPALLAATEAALALRPDSPRYLTDLAGACMLNGRPDDALAALRRLSALGVVVQLDRSPDLAPLRASPGFQEVLRTMAASARPQGRATVALELTGLTGIIEGAAFRPATGEFFFGDVRNRCVWRRRPDGTLVRFSRTDAGLLGVFNVTVDEAHHLLWLTTSALPEIVGYVPDFKGRGALCALDLETGAVVHHYPLPDDGRDHCLGDLLIAPSGTIYVTDSIAPVIWRLARQATTLESYLETPVFSSLQGLALVDHDRRLVVSDYANGLWVVDLIHSRIIPIGPPRHTTLLGIDGLLADGNSVIAVQNGIEPQRVLRLTFAPDFTSLVGTAVLACAQPGFTDLTLPLRIDGRPHVITQSGWAGYEGAQAQPAPHPVQIMRVGEP